MALTALPTAPSADVIVLGLGAMGSHALWRLAARGVDVLGVEQFAPGHDRGGSHGQSRIIRTAYAEERGLRSLGPRVLASVARTRARVRHRTPHPDRLPVDRPRRIPHNHRPARVRLVPTTSPASCFAAVELKARFPQFAVPDDHAAVHDPDAGHLRPERAIAAAVAAARAHGARVLTATAVVALTPDPVRPERAPRRRPAPDRPPHRRRGGGVASRPGPRGRASPADRTPRRRLVPDHARPGPVPRRRHARLHRRRRHRRAQLVRRPVPRRRNRQTRPPPLAGNRRTRRPPPRAPPTRPRRRRALRPGDPLALTGVDPAPSRMQTCMYDLTPTSTSSSAPTATPPA
ncbi:FAD-dependent oxidoreductase [Yinghuangia aomiensis]